MSFTRRRFLLGAGRAGAGAVVLGPLGALRTESASAAPPRSPLTPAERRTLKAAVAQIVPAEGPGDWSAADVGADEYILRLLADPRRIYAGGPVRRRFRRFQRMSRIKRIGWRREVKRLRGVYRDGLAEIDRRAGGDFAAAPGPLQYAILTELDDANSPFFGALYDHTMEGVYGHPVYGGNRDYRAWKDLGYEGDVHGVRFPDIGPKDAPWNVYGGYAPEEMAKPGRGPTT